MSQIGLQPLALNHSTLQAQLCLERNSLTPTEYHEKVQQLDNQSQQRSLFTTHCRRIAEYLRNSRNQQSSGDIHFAWLYDFSSDRAPIALAFDPKDVPISRTEGTNRLIFLAGYPSRHKLLQLGDLLDIDPAFFDMHLSFVRDDITSCEVHPSYYTLPSHQQTIFQVSVPCIGAAPEDHTYERLSMKRAAYSRDMDKYLSDLRVGKGWKAFDSIVRAVEVHDSQRFSLQQNVTVLIKHSAQSKNWLGKLVVLLRLTDTDQDTVAVWSDAGADLTSSPKGPWIDPVHGNANTHFRPVMLPGLSPSAMVNFGHTESLFSLHQSISLLPEAYGTSIDPQLSSQDPAYALSELFAFIAVSISQYLDVIRCVLDQNLANSSPIDETKRSEVRAMLSYSYDGLEKRRDQTTTTLSFLRSQTDRIGSECSPALFLLITDYDYLLARNNELLLRCDHEWNVIMSEAAVEDAQWSRDQSKIQYRFVLLATIYVPLSFSCSIFGMTFFELGSLQTGFLLWTAVSAPLFVISVLFLFTSLSNVQKFARQMKEKIIAQFK